MYYNGYETVDIKAVVHSDSRSYSYETTDPHDEGWGIENGNFYDERTITVPAFIFDMEVLDEQKVLSGLFYLSNQHEVNELHNKIANSKRAIEEAYEELKRMTVKMGREGDIRIERGTLVKGSE